MYAGAVGKGDSESEGEKRRGSRAVSYDLFRRDIEDFEKWCAIVPPHTHNYAGLVLVRCVPDGWGVEMMFHRTSPSCHGAIYLSSWKHVSAT